MAVPRLESIAFLVDFLEVGDKWIKAKDFLNQMPFSHFVDDSHDEEAVITAGKAAVQARFPDQVD